MLVMFGVELFHLLENTSFKLLDCISFNDLGVDPLEITDAGSRILVSSVVLHKGHMPIPLSSLSC